MTNGVGEPWGAHILKIKHNYRHLGKDVELDIVESLKLVRDVGLVLRGATAALREGGLHVRPADVRAPSELCQPRRTDHLGAFLLRAHEACCLAWMMDEAQEAWLRAQDGWQTAFDSLDVRTVCSKISRSESQKKS